MITVVLCHHGHLDLLGQELRRQLSEDRELVIYQECGVSELLERTRGARPDIVVLLTGLPEGDDLENIRQVRAEYPEVPIVALSVGSGLASYEQPLVRAGVTQVLPVEEALKLPGIIHGVRKVGAAEQA